MTEQRPGPEVRLVAVVDLTGPYDNHRQVAEALREQTRRSSDYDTVIVRFGADAVRHNIDLGKSIAGAFFLSARRIEIHAPAGNVLGPIIHSEVARYVRLFTADYARETAESAVEPFRG